jgi:hypothetical protein
MTALTDQHYFKLEVKMILMSEAYIFIFTDSKDIQELS